MADDVKDRGARDRGRVNVHEDYEVRYWTEKWGVTKDQLVEAVERAGVSVQAVAHELGKSRP
jgi:transposase-like protein